MKKMSAPKTRGIAAKKWIVIFAALTVFAGAAAAQSKTAPKPKAAAGQKVSVAINIAPLIKGLVWLDAEEKNSLFAFGPSFEFRSHDRFTLGIGTDLYFGKVSDIDFFYFGAQAHGRGYPLSAGKQEKFFLDAGVGLNLFAFDGKTDANKGGFFGVTFSVGIGYKLMVTPKFFVEPSMFYVYAKTPSVMYIPTPSGWQPGLSVGLVF